MLGEQRVDPTLRSRQCPRRTARRP
jgi:hypothetical protein